MFSFISISYSSNPTKVYAHINILISFINQLLGTKNIIRL
jgi:hypothetical protein